MHPFRCGPDRVQACTFRYALRAPDCLSSLAPVLQRPSPAPVIAEIASHGFVAARSTGVSLARSAPCLRFGAPDANRRTLHRSARFSRRRRTLRLYRTITTLAFSSPAHFLASRHIIRPFSATGLSLYGILSVLPALMRRSSHSPSMRLCCAFAQTPSSVKGCKIGCWQSAKIIGRAEQ